MKHKNPQPIFLKDYTPPPFWIDRTDLRFELGETRTRVVTRTRFQRNLEGEQAKRLKLDGQELELGFIRLDGRDIPSTDIEQGEENLWVAGVPDQFELEVETFIDPSANTSLEGLFKTRRILCTQCEAEGFRKLTYYLDRPDVMASFTATLIGDRELYPVLLSNGNRVGSGELADGRHWARWHDSFKKPSYLFALVAGDLQCLEDNFVTSSKRDIQLQIYVEKHNRHKCAHAMHSLKRAMRWDEQVYGREYDLNTYMIVAVDDFNMGAMENKGLNIFNSKFVLADPKSATDQDYIDIESVIGHEYFHNWTGNRVTCRDWFQLTLKEGLTVFRDQQFTADMNSAAVKRIDDVNLLRSRQFTEDSGPMAHPIQPDSYMEIQNFYTPTVYIKGAEVIRMIRQLAGPKAFRRGMDLYFATHDGEAVTTEDFIRAMEDGAGLDLRQFRRWYHQSGTPVLHIIEEYDAETRCYGLRFRQSCPSTPGQTDKEPFHFPITIGLLNRKGEEVPLQLAGEGATDVATRTLELREPERVFHFVNIDEKPIPSVLREFSAPLKLELNRGEEDLAFLMVHDMDPFSRWDAGQRLALAVLLRLIEDFRQQRSLQLPTLFINAVKEIITNADKDRALVARSLRLPTEEFIAEHMEIIDVDAIFRVRNYVRRELAMQLTSDFHSLYQAQDGDNQLPFDAASAGRRALKNTCLAYLTSIEADWVRKLALSQFLKAENMTDQEGALRALNLVECAEREKALDRFFENWQTDPLVIDKWFTLHATAAFDSTLDKVRALTSHPSFELRNPNRVRALLSALSESNPYCFHRLDGAAYRFIADRAMELNDINPQLAARLATPLTQWQRHDSARQTLMREQLQRIRELPDLAKNVYEVVAKGLA